MERDLSTRSAGRVVLSLLIGVTLVFGTTALALTGADMLQSRISSQTITQAPTGADPYRKQLAVTAKVLDGPLIPGVRRPLRVTLKNPLNQPLKVTDVTVAVRKPAAAGCSASWVKTTSFHAGKKAKPITVRPHKTVKMVLSVQLKNLGSVNQDACKNTTIPMKIKATAKPG